MVQKRSQTGDKEGPTPGVAGIDPEPKGLLTFFQAHWSQIPESNKKRGLSQWRSMAIAKRIRGIVRNAGK